jgi:DNA-binding response OmpR family regulator
MKVLAVDDNPMTGILLNDTLADLGHESFIAGDAGQALEMFERHDPHVCILDWMMPGTNGLELACAIRKHRRGPGVYIIMLSSKDDVESVGLAYKLGIDDFIMKPVAPGELEARLRTAARLVSLQAQHAEKCEEIAVLAREIAQQKPGA